MYILVLNCGSSSIKLEVVHAMSATRRLEMKANRVTEDTPELDFSDEAGRQSCPASGHEAVLRHVLPLVRQKLGSDVLAGVGHRVVHGGARFQDPTLIDEEVMQAIQELAPLAPLHNPINLIGIQIAREVWPDLPQVAVFDTAFHATLPKRAQAYALPQDLSEKYGLRRFGFHGTSHAYVSQKAAEALGFPLEELRLITCHLGSGASMAAVEYGRSIETSMGLTPLEGLVMGTRSGDVDPGILTFLAEKEGWSPQEMDRMLNKESGLRGLAGRADMRDIEQGAAEGDEGARLAIQVFTHRLRKYLGAYAAVMGGVDAIVFTGGIGENSQMIRERTAQRLNFLGAVLDEDRNRDAEVNPDQPVADISQPHSRCKLLVVKTDEQFEIARQAAWVVEENYKVKDTPKTIPVAISARHVHLTQETLEQLFGAGHQLTVHKMLSQPGQFAAKERLTLIGPKNQIERVRILGPTRSLNQVEISRTDEFFLGIDAPVRASGHVENTPGLTLSGPAGQITLQEGVICAWRHIHMTPEDAETFGVADKDIVEVEINNQDRSLTFGNVLVRVSPKYALEMHIDTDEGNAAEIHPGAEGMLIDSGKGGHLLKKHSRHA
ncbi:MAG: acetate/propionate family kinase [Bacteroidota bacterium]